MPVTNVHMMGDIEVMGDGGLAHLRQSRDGTARAARSPTTTNARCFDFAHVERLGQDAGEANKEREPDRTTREMRRRHRPTPASTTRRSTSRISASTSPGATPAP